MQVPDSVFILFCAFVSIGSPEERLLVFRVKLIQHGVGIPKCGCLLVQVGEGKTTISVQLSNLSFDVFILHWLTSSLEKNNTLRKLLNCFFVCLFLEVKIAALLKHTDLVGKFSLSFCRFSNFLFSGFKNFVFNYWFRGRFLFVDDGLLCIGWLRCLISLLFRLSWL